MTDNEIIKALECYSGVTIPCIECAYIGGQCRKSMAQDSIDLIKRQKTEIERLKIYSENLEISQEHLLNECAVARKAAKSEAIKEFAEMLKEKLQWDVEFYNKIVFEDDIDNLVKEMTEVEK